METPFRYAIFIGRPPSEVWNALTIQSIVDRYHMAPLSAMDPKPGGKISYGSPDSDFIGGVIKEIHEARRLVHSFRFLGSDSLDSTATFELKPVGGAMCLLEITHAGFPLESQAYADVAAGWPVIASSLKTLLERGHPLPWPKE
jgi:uncharacterized protein YndB with AHSA1/START domain